MLFKKELFQYNKLENIFKEDGKQIPFLIFFRASIALVALIEILSLYIDLPSFFSEFNTLVPRDLMFLESGYLKYLLPFYDFLNKNEFITLFYKIAVPAYIVSLLFFLFGIFTRYSAVFALLLQLIIFKSFGVFNYGYDFFLTMSLFYCIIFPTGNYFSVDSKIFNIKKQINFNYRRVIQIHLAMVYFFSGIAKGLDAGWWNGNSVWKAIASMDNSFYSIYPFILTVIGIGTVLLELFYPFFVYKKNTRKYTIIMIILMHTTIALVMDLYAFSGIMIVWNIAGFVDLTQLNKISNEKI